MVCHSRFTSPNLYNYLLEGGECTQVTAPPSNEGQIQRVPLGSVHLLQIDEEFLCSKEGKALESTFHLLKRENRLSDKNFDAFCKKANGWLKEGTCVGESYSFMLHRRPCDEDRNAYTQDERIEAIFFQLQHNMRFHVSADIKQRIQRLEKECKRLEKRKEAVDKRATKAEFFQGLINRLTRKAERLKELKVSSLPATPLSKLEEQKLNKNDFAHDDSTNLWIGRACSQKKCRHDTKTCKEKSAACFSKRLVEVVSRTFSKNEASDFIFIYKHNDVDLAGRGEEAIGCHYILVQPGATIPRVYDSANGEVHLPDGSTVSQYLSEKTHLERCQSVEILQYKRK